EWYDFAIYGYFATAIGRHFFPHEDPVAQLLSAFGVFALRYLMRPVGGVLVGHIGDRFGRRVALTSSVAAMAIPTFLIGLLPGYATLGVLAPIALILLRMVQGLSVGGEYTSSMVFLVEHAPDGRRGLMGALASCGVDVGRCARRLGLAHPVPARPGGRDRRLLSAPACAGYDANRAAQARSDRRDAARSLADRPWLRRALGVQRRRLLRRLRLPRELAADCRRHCARARARDQLVEHGGAVAGHDRDRRLDRPHRAQARSLARVHSRLRRRSAGVPAVEPSVGTIGAAWTAWARRDDRALWRRAADHHGGDSAAAGALHGGSARLQYQLRAHRRLDALSRDLAGQSYQRGDRARVHDHGRGRRYLRDAAVVSRDLSHPVHRRKSRRGRGLRVTRALGETVRSIHVVKAARRPPAA